MVNAGMVNGLGCDFFLPQKAPIFAIRRRFSGFEKGIKYICSSRINYKAPPASPISHPAAHNKTVLYQLLK
jgi:hypothetical protein